MASTSVHIGISNESGASVTVTPVSRNQDFYPDFKEVPNVKKVQVFATKAGIIRTPNEFEGIVLKGVDKDYDWSFFNSYLSKGRVPIFEEGLSNEVLISNKTANRLRLETGDSFHMFFVKDDPNQAPNSRKFEVVGIFDSGL